MESLSIQWLVAQPLIYRVLLGTLHVYLLRQGKGHPEFHLTKGLDLFCASGLLSHELITGKSNDHKFVTIEGVKRLQPFVLGCVSALGSHIDTKHIFAFVVGHAKAITGDAGNDKIVE